MPLKLFNWMIEFRACDWAVTLASGGKINFNFFFLERNGFSLKKGTLICLVKNIQQNVGVILWLVNNIRFNGYCIPSALLGSSNVMTYL